MQTETMDDLIQIKAGSHEIQRRIASFMRSKREQLNLGNVADFCCHGGFQPESSCARVDAVFVCRKDSKSHLRVRRVLNEWGPQTRGVKEANEEEPKEEMVKAPEGVEERLRAAETHLKIDGPVPSDIYERIKNIEDRILYLEGLSPEYFQSSMPNNSSMWDSKHSAKKRKYSVDDLNSKIQNLQKKLTM
ncbi:MAP3K12-binding inhibitory protein 1-like [Bacillus rossius redtenbacheri]|uniref:MAP3K12-binding inhibitory protein 1-like n=1 Tax=Bacillus rossius redtenbacheri TaxID=93214 RepID=UPI002FDCEE6A